MIIKPVTVIFSIKSVLRRKQKNIFAILAITVGVSLLIGVTVARDSMKGGFVIWMTNSLGERDASITYSLGFFNDSISKNFGKLIESNDIDEIEGISSELILSVTAFNERTGQINPRTPIYGVDPDDDPDIFGKLITNNGDVKVSELNTDETYIGEALAEALEVEIEDEMNITLSFNKILIKKTFKIKNIVVDEERGATGGNVGLYFNKNYLQRDFINWVSLGLPEYPITRIIITIDNHKSVNNTALMEEIKVLAENEAATLGLTELGGVESFIFSADREKLIDSVSALIDILSMVLAVFGYLIIFAGLLLITNIQLMSVEDRERQTGIMKAVGTLNTQILKTNLIEFIITGILGGLIGIVGGILYGIFVVYAFGIAFGFSGSRIPIVVSPEVVVIGFFAGFLIALITGLLPAWRASRVNIVEVMRGFKRIPTTKSGMKTLYFGAFIAFIGILMLLSLEVMPWEILDPEKYSNVNDAEALFLPPLLIIIGSVLILSYFINRDLAMNISALVLILYPSFHIFVVFDWVREGSGGMMWLVYLTLSMVIGFISLIGVNLNRVADLGEKLFGKLFPDLSMVAFRQMASQKMRSTITFAIFATVLTLNILVATWSHSARFGSDYEIGMFAANSDIIVVADQRIPTNLSFEKKVIANFKDVITNAKGFTSSDIGEIYLSNEISKSMYLNVFALNDQSLWDENNKTIFNFLLDPVKLNVEKHDYTLADGYGTLDIVENTTSIDRFNEKNTPENDRAWRLLAKDIHVVDSSGKDKPMIFMAPIGGLAPDGFSYVITHEVGDSVWLKTINGTLREFVVGAVFFNNPLLDIEMLNGNEPVYGEAGAFINEQQAKDLEIFNPATNFTYLDNQRYFLFQTDEPVNSEVNAEIAQDIEKWGNSNGNSTFETFKDTEGMYGITAFNVYIIYESLYDGMYRMFSFLQVFTSIGFLVGVLALLVVSIRSVATRKREIGMMRAIGLKKHEIVMAIVIELITMSVIGLLIALFTGNLLAWAMVDVNSSGTTKFLIPWNVVGFYTVLTLTAAFIAAVIPGRLAAKIPPSDALRYVG